MTFLDMWRRQCWFFFADDTNLLIIERDEDVLQHKVNEVMRKLENGFQKLTLMINISTT